MKSCFLSNSSVVSVGSCDFDFTFGKVIRSSLAMCSNGFQMFYDLHFSLSLNTFRKTKIAFIEF